ncbi:MAG: DUF4145 domain-containing protein [Candidatus Nitrosopumilus sp. bin_68KS]
MDKRHTDELIWGDFESEIIEMQIPLWTAQEVMRANAMDGAYALFNGFLTFVMFKLGYKPKLPENFKADLEDNSWWVDFLEKPEFMGLSFLNEDNYGIQPFVFKQFSNKLGEDITICILLDWYGFYECGLALKKSKLPEELKYTDELKNEFRLRTKKNFESLLKYMKHLKDKNFADAHKLVLRSDKLADFIIALNEMNDDLYDFPNDIMTNEKWNRSSYMERSEILGSGEIVFCTEYNFRELLKKSEIKIPNVEFISFGEFIQDKLDSTINEWSDIRDRYISRLKDSLKGPYISKNYSEAINHLKDSEKLIESKNYSMAVISISKAIESAVNTFSKNSKLPMRKKIESLRSHPELKSHVRNLHHAYTTRSEAAHDSGCKITEDDARDCFGIVNRFLQDIQKTI